MISYRHDLAIKNDMAIKKKIFKYSLQNSAWDTIIIILLITC